MSAVNTATNKVAATLADMQQNGVKNMAALTRLFSTIYAPENINFQAIQTKQALQAAGACNAAMLMDEALYAILDNDGLKLSDTMQAAALNWLRAYAKKRTTVMAWREKQALAEGAQVCVTNTHAEYNRRTGENLYYKPVFEVYNTENGESFQYIIQQGKPELVG